MSLSRRILISLPFDLDVGAGVLAEEDLVADLARPARCAFAVVAQLAGADGDDLAALRLLLGGVGQQDAAGRLLLRLERLDHDAVVQRPDLQVDVFSFAMIDLLREFVSSSSADEPSRHRDVDSDP